jgi:hypothetical protein
MARKNFAAAVQAIIKRAEGPGIEVSNQNPLVALLEIASSIDRLQESQIRDADRMERSFHDFVIKVEMGFAAEPPIGVSSLRDLAENGGKLNANFEAFRVVLSLVSDADRSEIRKALGWDR